MRARIFHIVCREFDNDGNKLIDEQTITKALAHKSFKKWAYIKHDKDKVTSSEIGDEVVGNDIEEGAVKPSHFHIVICSDNAVEVETVSKWFGIAENFIDVPKGGRRSFLDCVEYLTHENERQKQQGKYHYSDDCVKANFDWRSELNRRAAEYAEYGQELSPRDKQRFDVMYNGKSLRQCQEDDKVGYLKDYKNLKPMRLEYLSNQQPPRTRLNFYVYGESGIGKGIASRALARNLFKDVKSDEEIFFEVGDENTTFEGYDGQPVIIWNDCRSSDLLDRLHSQGNIFNVFDTMPVRTRQNIKYSSVNLINSYNIVNSIQTYTSFLDGLSGFEDVRQAYRRFPFIVAVKSDGYDLLVNKGFYDGSEEFLSYYEYKDIVGSFSKVRAIYGNSEQARNIEAQMLSIPITKCEEVLQRYNSRYRRADYGEIHEYEDWGMVGSFNII